MNNSALLALMDNPIFSFSIISNIVIIKNNTKQIMIIIINYYNSNKNITTTG